MSLNGRIHLELKVGEEGERSFPSTAVSSRIVYRKYKWTFSDLKKFTAKKTAFDKSRNVCLK